MPFGQGHVHTTRHSKTVTFTTDEMLALVIAMSGMTADMFQGLPEVQGIIVKARHARTWAEIHPTGHLVFEVTQ